MKYTATIELVGDYWRATIMQDTAVHHSIMDKDGQLVCDKAMAEITRLTDKENARIMEENRKRAAATALLPEPVPSMGYGERMRYHGD